MKQHSMWRRLLSVALRMVLVLSLVVTLTAIVVWTRINADRAFKVNADFPTASKPQSKLWYDHDRWWAWLPDREGSSIWLRGEKVWQRVATLDNWLREVPGHADVWADDDGVTAVLAAPEEISVARLVFDQDQQTYVPLGDPIVWPFPASTHAAPVAAATIARDGDGRWWVCYDHGGSIWVRASRDRGAEHWEEPFSISEKLDGDDLCTIFPLRDGIGVVWTDQSRNTVFFRRHEVQQPFSTWRAVEVIEQGEGVVNNHLNAAVATDGTVYVASKTNRYVVGQPMLVLRIRTPTGSWQRVPFANYTGAITPTRPIVLLDADEEQLWVVHTALDNSQWNMHAIMSRSMNRHFSAMPGPPTTVIAPHLDLQNATSCKSHLPRNAARIVLASDRWGNVYEGLIQPAQQP